MSGQPEPRAAGNAGAPEPVEVRSASGGLVVTAAGQTDIGCHRQVNQDSLGNLVHEPPYAARAGELGLLYAVADGMGGHARGEVASALAIENLFSQIVHDEPLAARKGRDELGGITVSLQREGGELQPDDPALGGPVFEVIHPEDAGRRRRWRRRVRIPVVVSAGNQKGGRRRQQ